MTASAETFPLEKVRASFPALEREVGGKPVAYLDSGASSQRVLASIGLSANRVRARVTVRAVAAPVLEQWAAWPM